MSGQFRGRPRWPAPLADPPIAPQPTHTRLRRARKRPPSPDSHGRGIRIREFRILGGIYQEHVSISVASWNKKRLLNLVRKGQTTSKVPSAVQVQGAWWRRGGRIQVPIQPRRQDHSTDDKKRAIECAADPCEIETMSLWAINISRREQRGKPRTYSGRQNLLSWPKPPLEDRAGWNEETYPKKHRFPTWQTAILPVASGIQSVVCHQQCVGGYEMGF